MLIWLLLAQLFAHPVTHAYAVQTKQGVLISVTYTDRLPLTVCTSQYALDDADMAYPLASHCWTPSSVVGDVDLWQGERIDLVNFKVSVRYPDQTVEIALLTRLDT